MRIRTFLPALLLTAGVGMFWHPGHVQAEQIRLADGRFLQGDVEEVKEDGFNFRLTDSGGKVFLRWNQVDASLKQRLKNERDPDDGLNLDVTVDGARLELIDGTILEGKVTRNGNVYTVINKERAKGIQVQFEDVVDEGFIENIQIDATVMMSEREALALAEERRAPLETARQYYEMARIADKLGLYEEAKDYVTLGLASSPDQKLQSRLSEYETKLAELIRQKELLTALAAGRQLAKQHKYQKALDVLKDAKDTYKPTDAVLSKWEEVNADIDLEFTKFVITEWYKVMKPVIQAKLKDKASKDITVQEAMNWARREMDLEIQKRIAGTTMSTDPGNMKIRFAKRFEMIDAKTIKLGTKKATFGEDGFYQIIGGHLPVAGKQPNPTGSAPGSNPAGRGPNGGGNPNSGGGAGASGGGKGPGSGIQDHIDLEKLMKELEEMGQQQGPGFQQGETPKLPDNITPDDIKDALRKALGSGGEDPAKAGESKGTGSPIKQDISQLKVPNVVPSLTEWWDKASSTTRIRWLTAVYVKFAGTMRVLELDDWDIKYR